MENRSCFNLLEEVVTEHRTMIYNVVLCTVHAMENKDPYMPIWIHSDSKNERVKAM